MTAHVRCCRATHRSTTGTCVRERSGTLSTPHVLQGCERHVIQRATPHLLAPPYRLLASPSACALPRPDGRGLALLWSVRGARERCRGLTVSPFQGAVRVGGPRTLPSYAPEVRRISHLRERKRRVAFEPGDTMPAMVVLLDGHSSTIYSRALGVYQSNPAIPQDAAR